MILRYRVLVPICAIFLWVFCVSLTLEEQPEYPIKPATRISIPIAVNGGEIGELLRKWYAEGTAAGNFGDYYDNRDNEHSGLNLNPYPQLQETEYTEEQVKARLNYGIQSRILPFVVFGNSSTSAPPEKGGSNARNYYTQPSGLDFLFAQYVRNNLYIYPEHRDYDPGRNGEGGFGDLYPTNTPYLIITQGSSGSDQPFMKALPYVLAAFRPEVKERLVQSGLLMPTIQMILRITNKQLVSSKEYLTGKAHPTVFRGSDLNVLGMVRMAHDITLPTIPPIALIKAIKENNPVNGMDYFEPECTEKLADTPAVIARIIRGSQYLHTITVSAESSKDINDRSLKYHWVILRGDPDKIRIEYTNSSRSIAEITVPYHERFPISKGSNMESNRVDIGVFVYNGVYYSAPAFITFYTLDSETRTYRADGQPLEIAYGTGKSEVTVVDWAGLFNLIKPEKNSWPAKVLLQQFNAEEISALIKVSEEFNKVHTVRLSEEKNRDTADAEIQSTNIAVREAIDAEKRVLENKILSLGNSASELVHDALNSMLQDPYFCLKNSNAINSLYVSSDPKDKDAFNKQHQSLVLFGVAENFDGFPIHLKLAREGESAIAERLTRFEKEMLERLNSAVISHIVFPGIVEGSWRKNYVDYRIASEKEWRDVYRYSEAGKRTGWLRYQPDGIKEFNTEGLLVETKDKEGRCVRARVVRYELEPPNLDSKGGIIGPILRKIKLVRTDSLREYENGE